jgi:hypothetical protein
MFRVTVYGLIVLGLASTGCQKARMKSVPPRPATETNTNATPQSGPPPEFTPPPEQQPDPRDPSIEPADNNSHVPQPDPDPVFVDTEEPGPNTGTRVEDIPRPLPRPISHRKPILVDECAEQTACKPLQPINGQCAPIQIDSEVNVTYFPLDILFVLDTSASLRGGSVKGQQGELEQLASQMDHYIKKLDKNTHFRIGVILGHGPASHWHGRLYKNPKNRRDPLWLEVEGMKGRSDVAKILRAKMKSIPNESKGAQGEAMLYSLYSAVTNGNLRNFTRDNAKLQVILVSDEQDVCYNYAGPDNDKGWKAVEVPLKGGGTGEDPIESEFREKYCRVAFKGSWLTPSNVYQTLRDYKNKDGKTNNLLLAGIVYEGPVTPHPEREDENEMGHGIIDLVKAHNGVIKDFAKVDRTHNKNYFAEELAFLGEVANESLDHPLPIFACEPRLDNGQVIHPRAVNPDTVSMVILRNDGAPVASFAKNCATRKNCAPIHVRGESEWRRGSKLRVDIVDELDLKARLKAKNVEKGQAIIRFKTNPMVDPETGNAIQ